MTIHIRQSPDAVEAAFARLERSARTADHAFDDLAVANWAEYRLRRECALAALRLTSVGVLPLARGGMDRG
jgi:hypothetical protein